MILLELYENNKDFKIRSFFSHIQPVAHWSSQVKRHSNFRNATINIKDRLIAGRAVYTVLLSTNSTGGAQNLVSLCWLYLVIGQKDVAYIPDRNAQGKMRMAWKCYCHVRFYHGNLHDLRYCHVALIFGVSMTIDMSNAMSRKISLWHVNKRDFCYFHVAMYDTPSERDRAASRAPDPKQDGRFSRARARAVPSILCLFIIRY